VTIDNAKTLLPAILSERIPARAAGYSFLISDDKWVLDKNVSINVGQVAALLSEPCRSSFLQVLAFYAKELSSHHTKNCIERFFHLLCSTGITEITDTALINYRAMLDQRTEWYLGTIRGFLRRWHHLGYPGVSDDVVRLFDGWRLKGNRKGDAVKRKDPEEGPLTDIELQAFNEGAVQAYEQDIISLAELAICLVISNTGRRPVQVSHLRVADILDGKNKKEEPIYFLNIPLAKRGDGFRASFKPFAITQELWAILASHAKSILSQVEACLAFKLEEEDRKQTPLFPDFRAVYSVATLREYRQLLTTDKLHIPSGEITDILQFVVEAAEIRSERTLEILHITSRRFRYTTGTRAAREGFGELVIAELLDHTDTQNAGVYIKNIPEHVKRLDEAVGFQLAPYAQAFAGVLVDAEKDARRGNDPTSRIRTDEGKGIGTCGEYGFCGGNVPIPCYTCMHFQPWLDGPHKDVYRSLHSERNRLIEVTGDIQIAAVLDRTIDAVKEVIVRCGQRQQELHRKGTQIDG